jgi:serine-type D-Ala-D-Ala carboxypeptidase/endopeptidase (penicillin-binding protein 4)
MTQGAPSPGGVGILVLAGLLLTGMGWSVPAAAAVVPGTGAPEQPTVAAALGGAAPTLARALDPSDLARRIDAILSRPPLDGIHWGVLLVDPASGEVLYDRNGHRRFVPASNMKVPVTAAALARLGPDYRFRTTLYAAATGSPVGAPEAPLGEAGPAADLVGGASCAAAGTATAPVTVGGTIPGDLVLAGEGDPTLGPPFHDSGEAALAALADSLWSAGVRRVGGALVVDASAWDSTSVPTGWLVGNLDSRFASTGGAFAISAGELEIRVAGAGAEGQPARVSWRPVGTPGFVENRVTTRRDPPPAPARPGDEDEEDPRLRTSFLPESRRWVVEGTVPPGSVRTLVRAQRDPVRQATHALLRAVEARGIPVEGGVRIVWDRGVPLVGDCASGSVPACCVEGPAGTPTRPAVPVAALESPPLTEIVRAILEPSQNWMTEQLVRTLGAEIGEEGSWPEGFDVTGDFLTGELGIDTLDVHFRDGSGLAAYNLITPRALIRVLDDARTRPWSTAFRDAMAEPGRPRTTLAFRLRGLEGRVFAKTGTISHVNSLAGFLLADDGRELLFVVMANGANLPARQVRDAIDSVVREMARP